jgi:hypothetical protein
MPAQTQPLPTTLAGSPSAEHGAAAPPAEPRRTEPTPFILRREVRLVIYGLLVGFVLLMLGWAFIPRWLDPTFEKHITRKEVVVGMSRQQVLQAWGSPYTINVSYTKDGVRREEWIYEDWKSASMADVKHRYLYFEEGFLVGGWYYK